MELLLVLKTRLDLEFSSPAFNKHTFCKKFSQKGQNRHIICDKHFSLGNYAALEFVERRTRAPLVRSRYQTAQIA